MQKILHYVIVSTKNRPALRDFQFVALLTTDLIVCSIVSVPKCWEQLVVVEQQYNAKILQLAKERC